MNKTLTAGAVLVLSLVTAPIALAQDDRECNQAQREVTRVELRLSALVTEERAAEQTALRAAQEALDAAQTALRALGPDATQAARDAARAAVDTARERRDAARDVLNTDSRRLADLRVELTRAIESRDEACDEDPPTTTTPPPTSTVTTTPPAAEVDVDCDEVNDAEAQRILDQDRSDPNNLDTDDDGVACEEEVTLQPDTVVVPNGGVNTGGGPA